MWLLVCIIACCNCLVCFDQHLQDIIQEVEEVEEVVEEINNKMPASPELPDSKEAHLKESDVLPESKSDNLKESDVLPDSKATYMKEPDVLPDSKATHLKESDVASLGTVSLDEKIRKFQQGQIIEKDFNLNEMRTIHGRFKTALARPTPKAQAAKSKWDQLSQEARGKNQLKRGMLLAWMRDQQFGEVFQEQISSVRLSKISEHVEEWGSWKQMEAKYDDEELTELLATGVIQERIKPGTENVREWQPQSTNTKHSFFQANTFRKATVHYCFHVLFTKVLRHLQLQEDHHG